MPGRPSLWSRRLSPPPKPPMFYATERGIKPMFPKLRLATTPLGRPRLNGWPPSQTVVDAPLLHQYASSLVVF